MVDENDETCELMAQRHVMRILEVVPKVCSIGRVE